MNPSKQSDILPEPPDDLKRHSDRLVERIRARIDRNGPISFAEYMEMALYEPGLGYYSAGLHKFGAEGDFITAPELGDIFAACMARQVTEITEDLGEFNILEIGAGSGKLAAQMLSELHGSSDGGAAPSRRFQVGAGRGAYKILERSADLRAVQKKTIRKHVPERAEGVVWLDRPPVERWRGAILANEVVDALPVERFAIRNGEARQICVAYEDGRLCFTDRSAPADLDAAVSALGPLPDGYRSEINLHLAAWVDSVTSSLDRGVALFIDYGYPRREYYLRERSDGTLIANYRHRAHDDVLFWPGLQDLTSFVDFTALAQAGDAAGLDLLGYTTQAMFLMSCGLDEVVAARLHGDAGRDIAVNNEVRQLMLPGVMGEKFKVMALGRNWPAEAPLRGFSFRDLRNRL